MTTTRRRTLGILLLLTFVVALGALFQDFRFTTTLAKEHATAITADRDVSAAEIALAHLREAQAGYVATGQGPAFWMTRATELVDEIDATLGRLRTSAATADARTHYDTAATALTDLKAIDGRARAFVTTDRRFEASDLIFVDASDPVQRLSGELRAARSAEQQAAADRMTWISRAQLGMVVVVLAFVLLVASFFYRAAVTAEASPAEATDETLSIAAAPASTLSLRSTTVSKAASSAAIAPAAAGANGVGAAAARTDSARTEPAWANLADAADLCVDLGRVIDARDLPALLERAAGVLGATGIVLWSSDSGGALLRPSVTHGYPDRVVSKLGTLQVDGDNATSLAFRSMRAQMVSGASATARGALAVPLVTASGCVGVLSAEVTRQRPDKDTLAVARMIAAQFAAITGPSDSAVQRVATS